MPGGRGDWFTFVDGSVTDETTVEELIAGQDLKIVYHEAAQAGCGRASRTRKSPILSTTGLLNVLAAAEANGVRRLVNASSSVYGASEYPPYDEAHPTRQQSPYGVTKLAAEHYCRMWIRCMSCRR